MKELRHVFGPVPSRRLGLSLGVDVVPVKVCSLNCIYCEAGRTTDLTLRRAEYVPAPAIIDEIRSVLAAGQLMDVITFSGSGEPTLNSKIGEMIHAVKQLTKTPIAVLTNGTLLFDPAVRQDLLEADIVLPSLDAASPDAFRAVNRPHGRLDLDAIIEGLVQFRREFTGRIWLEILLVKDVNDSPEEIGYLKAAAAGINPDRIQLNTVIRPPAEPGVQPLTLEELERIREKFGERCEVVAAYHGPAKKVCGRSIENAIASLVARRPVTIDDLVSSLGYSRSEVLDAVEALASLNEVSEWMHDGRRYLVRANREQQGSEPFSRN